MMELSAVIRKQIEADIRRGFAVDFGTELKRHEQLMRDLVGLVGEVGEFANLLKKVGLTLTTPAYSGPTLAQAASDLREELADAVIYIFRLSTILGGDLERDLLDKMKINEERYRNLER
jgi:NTP pyrophosphatase (non-canonical NTP hydrolase)